MDIIFDSKDHQNELTLCGNRKEDKYCFFLGAHCYKVFDCKYEVQFNKERELLATLKGIPSICSIEQSGYAYIDGHKMFCIQMPYYGSRDVLKQLSDESCLDEKKMLSLIKSVVAPFLELEKKGYRHNDIAQANLLAYNKRFVLIDFGSAVKLEDIQNGTYEINAIEGHIDYLAPEKKDKTIQPESDIYSFGVLLDEMLNKGIAKGANYSERLVQISATCKETVSSERFRSFQEIMDSVNEIGPKCKPVKSEFPKDENNIVISSPSVMHTHRGPTIWSGLVVLILSLIALAEETYMTFRQYSDDPIEQDALHHPSVIKDLKIIKNDIITFLDYAKNN